MKNLMDVMIVDDQPGMRQLLGFIVKEEGHYVHMAQNGLEAVEMVRKIRPQLIFMDVKMPVMDGLEALSAIKSISPETEVVMMTAYITMEIKRQAEEKGAKYCLTKPFELEQVKNIIKNNRPDSRDYE